jgi:hypothetical protein
MEHLSFSFHRFTHGQNKSFVAMKAMDAVVPSRVIQDLIHFPAVVFLAIRTDNLKHSPSPIWPNLSRAVRLVKEISGRFFGGESLPDPPNKHLNTPFSRIPTAFHGINRNKCVFLEGKYSIFLYGAIDYDLKRCIMR